MPEGVPRFMLALAAVVAFLVVFIGVRDYFQQRRETKSAASAVPTPVAQPEAKDPAKKTASASARRKRSLETVLKAAVSRQAFADENEDSLAPTLAKSTLLVVKDNSLHAVPAPGDEVQAASVRDEVQDGGDTNSNSGPAHNKANTRIAKPGAASSQPDCLPLPNMTAPGDVDAPYYRNWAREYSCQL